MKLSNAQIYTLRRMNSGTNYSLSGDGRKARELRGRVVFKTDDISAPSIPVLYRLGLVEFTPSLRRESGRYYSVKLTRAGIDLAKSAQIQEK